MMDFFTHYEIFIPTRIIVYLTLLSYMCLYLWKQGPYNEWNTLRIIELIPLFQIVVPIQTIYLSCLLFWIGAHKVQKVPDANKFKWIHVILLSCCAYFSLCFVGLVYILISKTFNGLIYRFLKFAVPVYHPILVLIFSIKCEFFWNLHQKITPTWLCRGWCNANRFETIWKLFVILIGALLLCWPLLFCNSCVMDGSLPPRPVLISHRANVENLPESTVKSVTAATKYPIYGIEVDIQISLDGIPFVLHDYILRRTTNVGHVFPGRVLESACWFTFEELRKLDAGTWKSVHHAHEKIPSFEEVLLSMKGSGKMLIFDLFVPPEGHPHRRNATLLTLDIIKKTGMESQILFLVERGSDVYTRNYANYIRQELPSTQLVTSARSRNYPHPTVVLAEGFHKVNGFHGLSDEVIKEYIGSGLPVMAYIVNKEWLYGQMWCAGVFAVTTDNLNLLHATEPWRMSVNTWNMYWRIVDGIGLLIIALKFLCWNNHNVNLEATTSRLKKYTKRKGTNRPKYTTDEADSEVAPAININNSTHSRKHEANYEPHENDKIVIRTTRPGDKEGILANS